jgi:hypothetical protein
MMYTKKFHMLEINIINKKNNIGDNESYPFFYYICKNENNMKFQALKVKTPEEILISDIEYLKDVFERMILPESKNDIYREIVVKQDELIKLLLEKTL